MRAPGSWKGSSATGMTWGDNYQRLSSVFLVSQTRRAKTGPQVAHGCTSPLLSCHGSLPTSLWVAIVLTVDEVRVGSPPGVGAAVDHTDDGHVEWTVLTIHE